MPISEAAMDSDLDLVCAQLRAIVEGEPGLKFTTLREKYLDLHGPLDVAVRCMRPGEAGELSTASGWHVSLRLLL